MKSRLVGSLREAAKIVKITNDRTIQKDGQPHSLLRTMTPPQRDRTMQVFYAQARGWKRYGDLLRCAVRTALAIQARREHGQEDIHMQDPLGEALDRVTQALEACGIDYAVTGSVATSVHGEPFSSLDVDLVVAGDATRAAKLAESLSPEFYAPADMLTDAAERSAFVNVVDNKSGLKVDFSFIGSDPYLRQALARRVRRTIGSAEPEFWFVTAEDVILMKLLWRKDTQSTKQWDNALGVARVRGARMDWKYLFENAKSLGVEDDLIRLRDEADI